MFVVVLVGLLVMGGTVVVALDRPFARAPRRHDRVVFALLAVAAAIMLTGIVAAVAHWW